MLERVLSPSACSCRGSGWTILFEYEIISFLCAKPVQWRHRHAHVARVIITDANDNDACPAPSIRVMTRCCWLWRCLEYDSTRKPPSSSMSERGSSLPLKRAFVNETPSLRDDDCCEVFLYMLSIIDGSGDDECSDDHDVSYRQTGRMRQQSVARAPFFC